MRLNCFACWVALLLTSCTISIDEDDITSEFIGSWKLKHWTAELSDGSIVYPYGERPFGKLIYEINGEMTGILQAENRELMSSIEVTQRDPEEAMAAFNSFFAYSGPFEVHQDSSLVIHHVDACINPNWVGKDQKRFYEFKNGQLILSTPPIAVQGTQSQSVKQTLTWEKVSG